MQGGGAQMIYNLIISDFRERKPASKIAVARQGPQELSLAGKFTLGVAE